jgi:hypothetical protein
LSFFTKYVKNFKKTSKPNHKKVKNLRIAVFCIIKYEEKLMGGNFRLQWEAGKFNRKPVKM